MVYLHCNFSSRRQDESTESIQNGLCRRAYMNLKGCTNTMLKFEIEDESFDYP